MPQRRGITSTDGHHARTGDTAPHAGFAMIAIDTLP